MTDETRRKGLLLKKTIFILIIILVINFSIPLIRVISGANAESVLFTLEVPSDGSRVSSIIALQNGVSYQIVVSGIYYTGTPIQNNQQDAMYASNDQWATHIAGQSGLYIDRWNVGSKQWGDYNSDHIYSYTLTGNGSQVNFWIYSSSYSSNMGSLTVQILGTPTAPQSPTPAPPTPTPTTSTTPNQTPITTTSPTASPTNSPSSTPNSTPTGSVTPTATISPSQITGAPSEDWIIIAIAVIVAIIVIVILAVGHTKKTKTLGRSFLAGVFLIV